MHFTCDFALANLCVEFGSGNKRCPSILLTVSIGKPFSKQIVVAKVCRAVCEVASVCGGNPRKVQRKALRWRFFTPSTGLDLASNQGNRHTFARPNMAQVFLEESLGGQTRKAFLSSLVVSLPISGCISRAILLLLTFA